MKGILFVKLKEALFSVLPVAVMVIILSMTPLLTLTLQEVTVFVISTVLLVLGIGLFNLGADLAMTPIGSHIGSGLTKSRNLWLLLTVCFAMGVLITVAEPDLSVLATQVADVMDGTLLIGAVGIGVGLFLVIAVLKMAFHKELSRILLFFYLMLFAMTSFVIMSGNTPLLPLAFDSGGVTTGPMTVPFIMALGVGIGVPVKGRKRWDVNGIGSPFLSSEVDFLSVPPVFVLIADVLDY